MVQMMIFVNLFIVPVVSLYFMYKKEKKRTEWDFDLLFHYCLVVTCNILLSKVFVFAIRKVSGIRVPFDSGYYTLAAFISALLIPVVLPGFQSFITYPKKKEYLQRIPGRFTERIKQRGIRGILKEVMRPSLLVLVSSYMFFLYEPILMYSTNINEFWFDFGIMIWPVLRLFARFSLSGIAIVLFLYFIDMLFSDGANHYKELVLIGFIAFFLLYIQGNWLSGSLPALTGEKIEWDNIGKTENVILVSIALFIIITVIICRIWLKVDQIIHCAAIGTIIVFVMLFTSLVSTVLTNRGTQGKESFTATMDNFNTISDNRNFLIFLVDTVDSAVFYDEMTGNEEFYGILDDFTFYPDTLSFFPFTRDSIPSILTGIVNHNETNFNEYCNNAYNQSQLFENLEQNGYAINLYCGQVLWGGERNYNIRNAVSIYDVKMDIDNFLRQELKYLQFKYLPYPLKDFSEIETLDFNSCKVEGEIQNHYIWGNPEFYAVIKNNDVLKKTDENYFQFVHCEGGHPPFDRDKELNYIDEGTYKQKVASSLTLIKAYLDRLKKNGTYDNSIIVIMADHGYETDTYSPDDNRRYLERCNPILFIKGVNEKHEMFESAKPVSYYDLQDAFSDLIDGKQSAELFAGIEAGRTRKVINALWSHEDYMPEYETAGNARDLDSFIPTGNIYILNE